MPTISPTDLQLKRWTAATVKPEWRARSAGIISKALANQSRYARVGDSLGVPWWAIAAIHNLEGSQNFGTHLHEGSPLTGRTRYVPKGRPTKGHPPFTWEESATDAIHYDKLDKVDWKDPGAALQALEKYNGLGYQKYHPTVPSPYLWSGTNLYSQGKYVADSKWSSTAVSKQLGAAAFLKLLQEKGIKVW